MLPSGAATWEQLAAVLVIYDTGVAVRFESQTFKVAGSCVPKRQEPQEVANVDPDGPRVSPGSGANRTLGQVAGPWMAALCLVWMWRRV